MIQIAIVMPSATIIGWLIGAWLDSRLHQSWIGVVGILFGGVSGLVYVVRLVIAAGNKSSAKAKSTAIPGSGAGTETPEIKP